MKKHWRNDQWIENIARETIQNKAQKEKKAGKNEQFCWPVGNYQRRNIPGDTGKGRRGIFKKIFEEIMAEMFSNLMKTINSQVQDVQWTQPSTRNMKKTTPRHIIAKLLKTGEKTLKASKQDTLHAGKRVHMVWFHFIKSLENAN